MAATVHRVVTDSSRPSTYHSPLRAQQARETRQRILNAAVVLFGDRGWSATTLKAVAEEAGTAVDTVYSAFESKVNLLMAAVDVAIVGDDEEDAMVDRPDFSLLGQGERDERIRAGVRYTVEVYRRSVPVLAALQEAAASEPVAHARMVRYDDDRRNLMVAGFELIMGHTLPDELIDPVWAMVSPEVFVKLTEGRGWSIEHVEALFVQAVTTLMAIDD